MIQNPRLLKERKPIVDDEIKAFVRRYLCITTIPEARDRLSEMLYRWFERKKGEYGKLIKEDNGYPGQESLVKSVAALDILLRNGRDGSFVQLVSNNLGVLINNLEEMRPIELFYQKHGDLYKKAHDYLETIGVDASYLESDDRENGAINQIRDYVNNPIDNPNVAEISELINTVKSVHAELIEQKRQDVKSVAEQCMGSIHTKAHSFPVDKKFVNGVDSYYTECKRRIASSNNSTISSLIAIEDEMINYENECDKKLMKMNEDK